MSDLIAIAYPDEDTARQVRQTLAKVTPDKVLPRIRDFGGSVRQTSLDEESEARLRDALEISAPAGAGA